MIYIWVFSGSRNPERNPEPGPKPGFSNSQPGNRPGKTRPLAEPWEGVTNVGPPESVCRA